MIKYLPLLMLIVLSSCQSPGSKNEFTKKIEDAHKKDLFLSEEAVQFDLLLSFGGDIRLDATITMLTKSTKIRIDRSNGVSLIYDGENVYQTPDNVDYKNARFDVFTWPYFFALPYKLSDPGTVWEDYKDNTLAEKEYDVKKLSFKDNTGDSPDDWYVIYTEPEEHLIKYAAYIVTLNRSTEKAEEDPHTIEYYSYRGFGGIPFATRWKFWQWRENEGLKKELGNAELTNIRFIEVDKEIFQKPPDGKLITR